MLGAEILYEMISQLDINHVSRTTSGAILPVFDVIYKAKRVDFMLSRHEQGAGHMAKSYARVSGVFLCDPRGLLLQTFSWRCRMRSATVFQLNLVIFCVQVANSAVRTDALQRVDIVRISRSCTKCNVMVKGAGRRDPSPLVHFSTIALPERPRSQVDPAAGASSTSKFNLRTSDAEASIPIWEQYYR
jgi:thiamine pyrophosphate-dependent acetolactate synthase large subunit-like protein